MRRGKKGEGVLKPLLGQVCIIKDVLLLNLVFKGALPGEVHRTASTSEYDRFNTQKNKSGGEWNSYKSGSTETY